MKSIRKKKYCKKRQRSIIRAVKEEKFQKNLTGANI
jgi:hypothetical protein